MSQRSLLRVANKPSFMLLAWEIGSRPIPLTYICTASKAFTSGRLDADYFSPRVADLLAHLQHNGHCIGDVAPIRREPFKPQKTGNFQYLEIGNVSKDGTVTAEVAAHCEAPSRATWHVHSGDVVTSMVRPIRRLSALITPEQDGFVCSSGFVVLHPESIAAEVLLTYLKLPPICELMDLHTSASLYPAISEKDILALPIPTIAEAIQKEIVAHCTTARQKRQQSAHLLEAAKHAVEIAIEENETVALAYLREQENLYAAQPAAGQP